MWALIPYLFSKGVEKKTIFKFAEKIENKILVYFTIFLMQQTLHLYCNWFHHFRSWNHLIHPLMEGHNPYTCTKRFVTIKTTITATTVLTAFLTNRTKFLLFLHPSSFSLRSLLSQVISLTFNSSWMRPSMARKINRFVLFCFCASHVLAADTLYQGGDSLNSSNTLVSKNGFFTLGFTRLGSAESNASYLAFFTKINFY